MNILISGCSFTKSIALRGGEPCWPTYLEEICPKYTITGVAESASGNQYICDSIVRETLSSNTKYDMVLVMWSGVSRLDYLTSLEDESWEKLFDSYGFYHRIPGGKLGWIFSGGQMGTWFRNAVAHKMFYEMYKVSSELSLATINLTEMVKLQNYLDAKKIPFKFMSYVNYWGSGRDLSPNGDFGIADFPELNYLVKEIDFSRWIFADDKRKCIYDIAKEMNSFMPDQFHPGEAAHRYWAELIKSRI